MKIAIDLLGGDNAPHAILGALEELLKLHPDWQ